MNDQYPRPDQAWATSCACGGAVSLLRADVDRLTQQIRALAILVGDMRREMDLRRPGSEGT